MNKKQARIVNAIEKIKRELLYLGPMRPGTLSRQFKNPKAQKGPFWQLSYTHRMKSKTEYVRPAFLPQIKAETQNFKKYKKLTQRWADLALQLSKENVRAAIQSGSINL